MRLLSLLLLTVLIYVSQCSEIRSILEGDYTFCSQSFNTFLILEDSSKHVISSPYLMKNQNITIDSSKYPNGIIITGIFVPGMMKTFSYSQSSNIIKQNGGRIDMYVKVSNQLLYIAVDGSGVQSGSASVYETEDAI